MAFGTVQADVHQFSDGTQILGGNVPFDNSAAVSDVALQVGSCCFVAFAAATSVPLHIACGDNQKYQFILHTDYITETAASGSNPQLNPNNTTYASAFSRQSIYGSGATATAAFTTASGFAISFGSKPHTIVGIISTATISKTIDSWTRGSVNSAGYAGSEIQWWSDTTTAWTSLGTLVFAYAYTGRAYIKRIA